MEVLLITLLLAVLPILPWVAGFWIVRHGPWPNRFWAGETVAGFTATVAMAACVVGFLIGGLYLGQFGPPLGVGAALPIGLAVGVPWALQRARRRTEA